jgi:hypothetical protein
MPKIEISIGDRFDRLTIVGGTKLTSYGRKAWLCRCECGGETYSTAFSLAHGKKRSCGCLIKEVAKATIKMNVHDKFTGFGSGPNYQHGQSRSGQNTPTYQSWRAMKDRCESSTRHNAANYKEKGISVCDRWADSFEAFFADMGERPSGHTLDRIIGSEGYSPDNCRWATPKEQAANRQRRAT